MQNETASADQFQVKMMRITEADLDDHFEYILSRDVVFDGDVVVDVPFHTVQIIGSVEVTGNLYVSETGGVSAAHNITVGKKHLLRMVDLRQRRHCRWRQNYLP